MEFLELASLILKDARTIAVVGISDNPERSSFGVAEYLSRYFSIVPVNPNLAEWRGLKVYKSLSDIPIQVDVVNVFRRSDQVLPVVNEAIKIGAKGIWMQLGVINPEAENLAKKAGIPIIMDSCIAVVDRQLRAR